MDTLMDHPDETRRRLAVLLAAALASPGLASPGLARASPPAPQTGTRLLEPPVDLHGEQYVPPTTLRAVADLYSRMSVPVRINGGGPYQFVVDTGANNSVIADALAARLGLLVGAARELHGVAGAEMAGTVTVDSLQVGDRVRRGSNLFVLPAAALGTSGLLGLDSVDGQKLVLDFKAAEMRIEASDRPRPDRREIIMSARRRSGQLTLVDTELAGVPVTAFIDSGAQNTIGNRVLQRRAGARSPQTIWLPVPILSATGQTISGEAGALPSFRMGGLSVDHLPVLFADLHTFSLWDLNSRPALLLGVDVLSRFERVSLDFARGEVRFLMPGGVRPPSPDVAAHSVSRAEG